MIQFITRIRLHEEAIAATREFSRRNGEPRESSMGTNLGNRGIKDGVILKIGYNYRHYNPRFE